MSSARKKIIDFSSIGLANIIASATAAIFWFYIASEIGPENYGEITYLISIAALISGLTLFGSGQTITVFSAKNIDIQKTLYLISLSAGSIGAITVFVLFQNIGISFIILAYSLLALITADLLGKKLYKEYSKYILLQKALLVVFGIGFFYLMGEIGILIGIAASHGFFIIKFINTLKKSKLNFAILKEKKSFILNSFALSISGTFYSSIDKLIIAPLLGFGILGNYSLGLQFFSILALLPSTSLKYLVPQDSTGVQNKKLKKIIVFISVGIAILGSTVGPTVISYIFPRFDEAENIIRIVSWAIIPSTINNVMFFSKFWAYEMNRKILLTSITIVVSQIIGIITLGPLYGANGIAASFVISMSFGTIFAAFSDRYIKIS